MYTRNSDPQYYATHHTNCGSFALSIKEWDSPDAVFINEYGEVEEWIDELYKMGLNDFDISDEFSWRLVDIILDDFHDLMYRSYCDPSELKPGEELIAFRTVCEDNGLWDFHFKVFRDGHWQEKMGDEEIQNCSINDWSNGFFSYISTTHYFIKKAS